MTPIQEDREAAADSGFTPENIADAEWLWTNMAVDHRKFHTLPTHHKALLCHTAQRFRTAALAALRETHHLIPKDQEPDAWRYDCLERGVRFSQHSSIDARRGWTVSPLYALEKRHD